MILQIIKEIANKMMNVCKAVSAFFKRVWGNVNRRKKKRPTYEMYDNTDWVEVKGKYVTEDNDYQHSHPTETTDDLNDFYCMVEENKLMITMPTECYHAANHKVCRTDENRHLTMVRDEDFVCMYPTVNIAGIKVNLYTGHTYMLNKDNIDTTTAQINPQVYVSPGRKTTVPTQYFKAKKSAVIMTTTVSMNENVVIDCQPTTHVNTMYMLKGKPKRGTIALVFTLIPDEEYVWSGSLVQYGKAVYIVSNATKYEWSGVVKLVAYSVSSHDVDIITE